MMKKLVATIAVSVFACMLGTTYADRTWDGGAGTDEWTDANNWNPDGIPSAERASIAGVQVDLTNAAPTISGLDIGASNGSNPGELDVQSGGSLTIQGWNNNSGTLIVSGGSVTFNGGATLRWSHRSGSNDRLVVNSGYLTFDGTRNQGYGGDFDVTVAGGNLVLTALQNRGFAIVGAQGTSTLTLSGTGLISSAGQDIGIGTNPGDSPPTGGTGLFNMSSGTLNMSGSTADLRIGNAVFSSTGTANISGGTATIGGDIIIENGSSLAASSSAIITVTDDVVLTGSSELSITDSNVSFTTNDLFLNDGTIAFTADATASAFSTLAVTSALDAGTASFVVDWTAIPSWSLWDEYALISYGSGGMGSATYDTGAKRYVGARPYRGIVYDNGAGAIMFQIIPEPASFTLLALAGLAALRRRK